MKRALLAVFALLLLSGFSSDAFAQRKPFVYDFLRNDGSARSSAMGGAFVSVADDPTGLLYNPALLNTVDSVARISFTGFKHVLDINSGVLAGAGKVKDIGAIGAAITYNSYGSFERTDRTGNNIGEFGSQDLILTVGWANDLGEGFSAGIGGKVLYSSIDDYSSTALALDGGVYFEDTAKNVQAGLSLQHLGGQISTYGEASEDLPIDLRLGVSHQLRGLPLLIALNFSRLLDEGDGVLDHFSSFSVGGEFKLSKPLRLRLGYNNRIRQDVSFGGSKGLAGLSAGLGILIDQYRFDYAFNSLSGIGGQHRITLNTSL